MQLTTKQHKNVLLKLLLVCVVSKAPLYENLMSHHFWSFSFSFWKPVFFSFFQKWNSHNFHTITNSLNCVFLEFLVSSFVFFIFLLKYVFHRTTVLENIYISIPNSKNVAPSKSQKEINFLLFGFVSKKIFNFFFFEIFPFSIFSRFFNFKWHGTRHDKRTLQNERSSLQFFLHEKAYKKKMAAIKASKFGFCACSHNV